jgi:hypothetical protein
VNVRALAAAVLLWHATASNADCGEGLNYLLHEGQVELKSSWQRFSGRRYVIFCARRYGKSRLFAALAIEQSLRMSNSITLIAGPLQKQMRNTYEPHFRELLKDCPPELLPRHRSAECEWLFPNGSVIRMAGTDNGHAEDLRGPYCNLALVDEAAFIDDLEYVVQSVLLPQTLTVNGRLLMASSAPRSPAHPFATRYLTEAEAEGYLLVRTIDEAPHVTPEQVAEYAKEEGGRDSTSFQREYLCRVIPDEASTVVPEFFRVESKIVEVIERPEFFHAFTSLDVGFDDLSVAAIGYVHFQMNLGVIEDEVVTRHMSSAPLFAEIHKREEALYTDRRRPRDHGSSLQPWEPARRVMDASKILVADANYHSGRAWCAAAKDDADAALNALRVSVGSLRLRIHPRCKTLIAHLRNGQWNKSRTSFERSGDFGHFDGIDAVKYWNREAWWTKNPYPDFWNGETSETHWLPKPSTDHEQQLVNAFTGRRRGRYG